MAIRIPISGSADNDTFDFHLNEDDAYDIKGLGGDDTLTGGQLGDIISGGGGNDLMKGEGGNDKMLGGGGDDVMFGGDPGVTMRLPHVPAPLQWWHGAVKIAASNIAIRELPNDPQDGFFQRKLVKGGPWIPARIWRDAEKDFVTDQETGFDVVKCEVAGKPRHPLKEFDALGRYPITKEKFDHLMAVGNWAKTYAPNSSEANPTQPIDWNKEPL